MRSRPPNQIGWQLATEKITLTEIGSREILALLGRLHLVLLEVTGHSLYNGTGLHNTHVHTAAVRKPAAVKPSKTALAAEDASWNATVHQEMRHVTLFEISKLVHV